MAMQEQRWAVHRVFSTLGWRWTYTLRGERPSIANYATSAEADRAARRAWKKLVSPVKEP